MKKWLAVIGTREATPAMRRDIYEYVNTAVGEGYGIVSGGGTGVDTVAVQAALDAGAPVKVYLPVKLALYATLLRERAVAGKCVPEDAEETIRQLDWIEDDAPSYIEADDSFDELSPEAFYARNARILRLANRVVAFHLSGNATASTRIAGTLKTAEEARLAGLDVEVFEYESFA